jgi:hypothetical protein
MSLMAGVFLLPSGRKLLAILSVTKTLLVLENLRETHLTRPLDFQDQGITIFKIRLQMAQVTTWG